MTLQVGQLIEVDIERLAAGGDALGHYEGRVVFVPLAAPGDRISARVTLVRPRFARAEIAAILTPSPARRDAVCEYYGHCGGCDWMHLDEATQSQARKEILRDALIRIGRVRQIPDIESLPSPLALGYRARARVAVESGVVGFRAAGSHKLVDVERCVVLDDATQAQLDALRRAPPEGAQEFEVRGFGDQALGLRVNRRSFVQPNAALWRGFSDLVVQACGSGELAVELYAGVGFFTVGLERSFRHVIAVERSPSARDLRHNSGARVFQTAAEAFAVQELPQLSPDLVLVNPPRSGCDKLVIDALQKLRPARLVYVSCDPSTLARDIALLGDEFALRRVVAVDALPQTHHVESVVVLDSEQHASVEFRSRGE
jgi:23S rRNA (uracil1939-C5)-methyltransferase